MKSISVPSADTNDCETSAGNNSFASCPIAIPTVPAIAPLANPTAAVLPTSATVPPAAALMALSTTVLNTAAVPITPNIAGPPTPAAPIPIVITNIIIPLNAATSSSFSIV